MLAIIASLPKRVVYLSVACLLSVLFLLSPFFRSGSSTLQLHSPTHAPPHAPPQSEPHSEPHSSQTAPSSWTFDPERDHQNYGLSDEQCDLAFPDLYHEIDRAVEHRMKVGNITLDDIDTSWKGNEVARVLIYDRQIYLIETKWSGGGYDSSRAAALLHALHRAIIAYNGPIPNVEFTFCSGDVCDGGNDYQPIWTLTRRSHEEAKWLMSDFGYWSWSLGVVGSYEQVRLEINDIEELTPFEQKKPQAVWRGAFGNPLRQALAEKTAGKPWSDVGEVQWAGRTELAESTLKLSLTTSEFCAYQYLIHTEGQSYSGRGKYLLNCHSVSITHKLEWVEPHHHLIVPSGPQQNMIVVERDWEELDEKMQYLLDNPSEAKRIADNSAATFKNRYLTPAAQACYWRRMIKSWANLQDFEPDPFEIVTITDPETGEEVSKRKRRGKTFEFYVSE